MVTNSPSTPSGFLVVNKPLGWTSSRVVQHLKRLLGVRKIGHCGTLDPRAQGVLVICYGNATRLSSSVMEQKKIYRARIRLGVTTDSGDLDGRVLSAQAEIRCGQEEIADVCRSFVGTIEQTPPMFSALKVNGQKLYDLARQGITVERQPRSVTIYSLEILHVALPDIDLRICCSKGTYIRVLAEDIGKRLCCGAVLADLVRESVGCYRLDNALSWEQINSMSREALLNQTVAPEQH
jgi:tRNA pseudouridine55 synthase